MNTTGVPSDEATIRSGLTRTTRCPSQATNMLLSLPVFGCSHSCLSLRAQRGAAGDDDRGALVRAWRSKSQRPKRFDDMAVQLMTGGAGSGFSEMTGAAARRRLRERRSPGENGERCTVPRRFGAGKSARKSTIAMSAR